MAERSPRLIIIAGPNGAGKTTAAPRLLRELYGIDRFVNADTIARGLSAFEPESVAFAAGRIMLARVRELAQRQKDFAFETTLATRSYAPWLVGLRHQGYSIHLIYLGLPNPETAVGRVEARVQAGGHGIPPEVIRRRYARGLRNFFRLYRPIVNSWGYYENVGPGAPRLIAAGSRESMDSTSIIVEDDELWDALEGRFGETDT